MFKFNYILLIALVVLFPIHVEAQEKLDVNQDYEDKALSGSIRGFIWGLPKTVILEEEKGKFLEEKDGTLIYVDFIRGIRCTIMYEFQDDKLWRGRIFIEKRYTDPQDRIEDLLVIQNDLNARFGEPISQDFKWLDETEKNFPEKWGWAVFRRELFITNQWQNADTLVTASLGAPQRFFPQLSVTYESVQAKIDKANKREDIIRIAP